MMVKHDVNDTGQHRWLFVMESTSTGTDGNSHRHTVQVCRDCGRFMVYGRQNGEWFRVEFELPTDELAEAAGQYAEMLKRTETATE